MCFFSEGKIKLNPISSFSLYISEKKVFNNSGGGCSAVSNSHHIFPLYIYICQFK